MNQCLHYTKQKLNDHYFLVVKRTVPEQKCLRHTEGRCLTRGCHAVTQKPCS